MKTSQRGIEFIKNEEGCKLRAYRCPAGVLTIGVGHTSAAGTPQVEENMVITEREAEAILASDLRKFEADILRLVEAPLTQSQFDALVSFVFNIGTAAFARSTLLRKLNKGDYAVAAAEFPRWNKSNGKVLRGLVNRRAKEAALFIEDDWEDDITPTPQAGITRDVPTIINTENVNAAAAVATGMGAMNLDGDSPMSWALAIIALVSAGVFFYLFLKRRGA